jgi:hypothetical protein
MVARVRGDVRLVRATLKRCLQCNSLDWVSLLRYTHDSTDRELAVWHRVEIIRFSHLVGMSSLCDSNAVIFKHRESRLDVMHIYS